MDRGDVRAKLESFGWDSIEIDGDDMSAIVEALERSRILARPAASSARPRRAAASPSPEGRFGLHRKPPSPEQASEALEELETALKSQTTRERNKGRGEG